MSGEALIGGWLNDLALMLGGKLLHDKELRDKVASMTAMLARKAPPDWFSTDSLEFCLRRFKFFPGYADLWARLQLHQRETSKQMALSAPPEVPYADNATLSDADRLWCKGWHKQRQQSSPANQVLFLDTLRRYAPAGFDVLCGDCDIARDIAERRGWMKQPEATAEEQSVISGMVASISHGFHAPREPTQAPISTVPTPARAPAVMEQLARTFEKKKGRKLGALSPERLKAVRMADPALRGVVERAEARAAARPPLSWD